MVWQDGCFFILGLFLLVVGILVRMGKLRGGYWFQPFDYYRTAAYGLIPLGASLLVAVGARPFLDTFLIIPLRVIMISCLAGSIFMWLFQPRFAKPDWINWLEDNHYDILPELRQELWRMGSNRKEIINNQAELEVWIEEFRQKSAP